ncbi:uncharacterized protein BX664DRAFT_331749 [Halteromyces radiatus]|uniref:uncharacterized protein n=1 Tax=Halteromyces radiatus TaxID=101107 RepID=UPI00221FA1EC|nr:uncharacterized protein BX664DRAFT_331749 [Halteromyces radiatus]KAI8088932.1 hypothetical protein BX664DRAFT_331749 [Halteromyces radiatus]
MTDSMSTNYYRHPINRMMDDDQSISKRETLLMEREQQQLRDDIARLRREEQELRDKDHWIKQNIVAIRERITAERR